MADDESVVREKHRGYEVENFKGQHMLLLLLKKPAAVETVIEILREMNVQSICLQGSEGTKSKEERVSELPFVGSFLRLLEQEEPEGKAVLTVLNDESLEAFEKYCEERMGDFTTNKELTALILPVSRSLGRRFKFAG